MSLRVEHPRPGKDPIAFGFQAYVMTFDKNVSFGLEQARSLEEQDFGAQAWTGEAELEAVGDRRLPAD